jgi:hypothetical protein
MHCAGIAPPNVDFRIDVGVRGGAPDGVDPPPIVLDSARLMGVPPPPMLSSLIWRRSCDMAAAGVV